MTSTPIFDALAAELGTGGKHSAEIPEQASPPGDVVDLEGQLTGTVT
ncbi:hypothetical protein SAMN04488564_10247 [Lentzea waywayandensis]|uniref:Uncharacterized protein n=1 Tax=Lentzea waywayandensis TaxID=84724 RepID=A0A1I6D9R2_9PSEU|nr:hypothetical protein [Lentzea waywayandensis]SFR02097.1 hypothetical protein SAMN04488564_10247 [Lentzea waywayandensis]